VALRIKLIPNMHGCSLLVGNVLAHLMSVGPRTYPAIALVSKVLVDRLEKFIHLAAHRSKVGAFIRASRVSGERHRALAIAVVFDKDGHFIAIGGKRPIGVKA
jgi:hypothetical protein